METKITEKMMFEAIKKTFETGACEYAPEEVIAFCDKKIEAIDNRAEKARERAKAKRAEVDVMLEQVESALTDEFMSIADIAGEVIEVNEEATPAKIQYRLNKLVAEGRAVKEQMTIPATETSKTRHIMGYKRAE